MATYCYYYYIYMQSITVNYVECSTDIICSLLRFDICLMKSGRMKGQAFVGLPSEAVAMQALRETNGYLLHGRPMVVVRQA